MSLTQAIGVCALASFFLYPLGYIPYVAEHRAIAVKVNAAACRSDVEFRKAQRVCELRHE